LVIAPIRGWQKVEEILCASSFKIAIGYRVQLRFKR